MRKRWKVRKLVANSWLSVLAVWLGLFCALGCGEPGAVSSGSGSGGGDGGGAGDGGESGGGPRLVILSPAIAVMAVDVGLEEWIVGKHAYDLVLTEAAAVVGDQSGIDYERLIGVRPTHVVTQWGRRALPAELLRLSERMGFAVVDYEVLTLDDIARVVDDLYLDFVAQGPAAPEPGSRPLLTAEGGRVRVNDPGEAIGEAMRRELPSGRLARAWRAREPSLAGAGRVLLLGAVEPPAAMGPGSFHHQVLERIGGVPAITEGSAWMELDAEDVLRLRPEGIVLIAPGVEAGVAGFGGEAARGRLGAIGGLSIPAVERGRVYVVTDALALLPSTRMAGFAEELAGVLAGWAAGGE